MVYSRLVDLFSQWPLKGSEKYHVIKQLSSSLKSPRASATQHAASASFLASVGDGRFGNQAS